MSGSEEARGAGRPSDWSGNFVDCGKMMVYHYFGAFHRPIPNNAEGVCHDYR